jgi:hypothetical protein
MTHPAARIVRRWPAYRRSSDWNELTRHHRTAWDGAKMEALFVDLFLEAHQSPPQRTLLDLDATDNPLHGHQEGRFFQSDFRVFRPA